MYNFIISQFIALTLCLSAFAMDSEFKDKLPLLGRGIDSLHFVRGWQSYLLNNFPHNNLEKNTWPELNNYPVELFSDKTIHIEIKDNLVLVNFIMRHPTSMASALWAYETRLLYDGQTWPLHELPPNLKNVFQDAEGLEFTYMGRTLPMPQALKVGILGVLQSNALDSEFVDCHMFAHLAGEHLSYKDPYSDSIEISFDRSLLDAFDISGHHNSQSENWTNLIPRIEKTPESTACRLNCAYAKPGANFFFRAGPYPFSGGHSAIEIGPNLLLSKMGRLGLTVAPVQALAFDEGSLHLRITDIVGAENGDRAIVESQFDEMKLENFLSYLRDNFEKIKALDEYERNLAWLSFTDPSFIETRKEFNEALNPYYEISAFEQFEFWLLGLIRDSKSADEIIDKHIDTIKKAISLTASEKNSWFDEFFFHEYRHYVGI